MLKLRPYQQAALERLHGCGKRRVMLCAPTGAGKTVLAAQLIADGLEAGERILFLAHRRELIRQPFTTLLRAGLDWRQVGIIMAGVPSGGLQLPLPELDASPGEVWRAYARRRPPAPVQIASVDSLRSRKLPPADRIIIDEAHRSLAKSYRRILDHYPDAHVTGLSATPSRTDGKGLDAVYEELVIVATYRQLVAEGFLVAPRVWSARRSPDLSRVKVVAGDYKGAELEGVMLDDGLVGDVVEHWVEHGGGAPTFGFAVSVEHSQRLTKRFLDAGIRAAHVDGSTPTEVRDRAFEDVASGRIEVLWNCDIAGEGTDVPAVKTVISARPTKSLRVWLQQAGRGARPYDSPHRFTILDHAANADEHGLPQIDREWTLEGRKKRPNASTGTLVWKCKVCQAANDLSAMACEECGAPRPVAERKPLRERDGRLVEVAELSEEDLRQAWDWMVIEWRAHNSRPGTKPRKPAWLTYRFNDRYGCSPPPGCRLPEWSSEDARRRKEWDRLERLNGPAFAAVRLKGTYDDDEFLPPVTTRWA